MLVWHIDLISNSRCMHGGRQPPACVSAISLSNANCRCQKSERPSPVQEYLIIIYCFFCHGLATVSVGDSCGKSPAPALPISCPWRGWRSPDGD